MADAFIVTGEASGDAIAAGVVRFLREARPELELEGIGSARMKEAGVRLWADSSRWASMGIVQAIPMARRLLALQKRLKRYLAENRPRVLVLVDFGAFNVRLGIWARENGIYTVYVMPSGSWRRTTRPERIAKMAASADLFLSPFRWNVENLEGAGAKAVHIGHPVLDLTTVTTGAEELAGLRPEGGRLVALLPGSRRHEVETLAPMMMEVVRAWPYPHDRFVMVQAPSFGSQDFGAVLGRAGALPGTDRFLVSRIPAADLFSVCDMAVVCSGTATLEAAVAGVPMVVVYDGPRLMRLEWRIRRRWLHVQHLAMPNIIANRRVVTELVAEDATAENVVGALRSLADNPTRREDMRAALLSVRETLEPTGALRAAAGHIITAAGF